MRVLAIDPGAKSGVCLIDTERFEGTRLAIIDGGLSGLRDWYEKEANFLSGAHIDAIVCESFEPEEGTHGIDYEPLEIIGWLKSLNIPIQWQRRNQRGKGKLISTAVLKRAGLYPKRGEVREGHQIAALQHALAFLVKIRHMPTIRLLHPQEES